MAYMNSGDVRIEAVLDAFGNFTSWQVHGPYTNPVTVYPQELVDKEKEKSYGEGILYAVNHFDHRNGEAKAPTQPGFYFVKFRYGNDEFNSRVVSELREFPFHYDKREITGQVTLLGVWGPLHEPCGFRDEFESVERIEF